MDRIQRASASRVSVESEGREGVRKAAHRVGTLFACGGWCAWGCGDGMRLRSEPPSPVAIYLARLDARLRYLPWRRARLLRESRDHLLEATERGMTRGLSRVEAEAVAVEQFGS